MTDVTIVVVNYRTPVETLACLDALAAERAAWPRFDVIVVDGGSGDDAAERIARGIDERGYRNWATPLPLPINGGFGYANNEAIRTIVATRPDHRYVHLLNPDAIPLAGAVRTLYDALEAQPSAATAGSVLLADDHRPLGSAFQFPTIRSEFLRGANIGALHRPLGIKPFIDGSTITPADWVTGASVMIRLAALAESGLFDEGFFLYFEEAELMHRLHGKGWSSLHVPSSRVVHAGGASTGVLSGASEARRLPGYWFDSRRRYFSLTRGLAATAVASFAWLFGISLWRLRCAVGLGRWSNHAPHEARDLIRHGIVASKRDLASAAPAIDSPTGRRPAWMTWSSPEAGS